MSTASATDAITNTATTTLFRAFYDRFLYYYYQLDPKGSVHDHSNFYNITTGEVGMLLMEGGELEALEIIVDYEHPAYIVELTNEYGVVYFDRDGYIVRQLGSLSEDDLREELGVGPFDKVEIDVDSDRELDGSGTGVVIDWQPLPMPSSSMTMSSVAAAVTSTISLIDNRYQLVENRLQAMVDTNREWTIGEGYELIDVDNPVIHFFFIQGPYFLGYHSELINLVTGESLSCIEDLFESDDNSSSTYTPGQNTNTNTVSESKSSTTTATFHDVRIDLVDYQQDDSWLLSVYDDCVEITLMTAVGEKLAYDDVYFNRSPFDQGQSYKNNICHQGKLLFQFHISSQQITDNR